MNTTNKTSFLTTDNRILFELPEGENIILHFPDDHEETASVQHIDTRHAIINGTAFDMLQYAEMCKDAGIIARPASVDISGGPEYYGIFQIPYTQHAAHRFMSYSQVQKHGGIHADAYKCVYYGYLSHEDTLESLFARHNMDDRPAASQMYAMSVSDIVVVNKRNELGVMQYAMYYVDSFGFVELLGPRGRKIFK